MIVTIKYTFQVPKADKNIISEVLVKREAGESPARTRRCNRGVWF